LCNVSPAARRGFCLDSWMPELSQVEALSKIHDLSQFNCGAHESLNLVLKKYALQNEANDRARTYVAHRANIVVGDYLISAGSISSLFRERGP
jgi:hypothetical protein